jgi:6-phosphogluconolactonase (cycloisomerase 2 family)
MVIVLAGLSLSCGNGSSSTVPNHEAYVTLPTTGSVLMLHIEGKTGIITMGTSTPTVQNATPTGLALHPSKKFLYAINSRANTISVFNVASDGSLTLSGTPLSAGFGPNVAVIDPSGQYLLVTNNFGNNVSVYSIDAVSGALTEVENSPFYSNTVPTAIQFTHSGKFVYVTNPDIGMVTAFSFSNGVLTEIPGSPFSAAMGGQAAALAVDGSDRFLYVANPSAANAAPYQSTTGNISGYNINPSSGALTAISGSPFTSSSGIGPSAVVVDPSGRFVYAVTPGSSNSIWCFAITSTNGQLTPVTNSPFSLSAGGLFATIDPVGNFFYIGDPAGKIAAYTYDHNSGVPTAITGSPFSTGSEPGLMVFPE